MWVNSIQIRSGKLSDADMVALGGPTAAGIPLAIAPLPSLGIARSAGSITVTISGASNGSVLESTPTLTNPTWTPVPGVVNNSVTLPSTGSGLYLRLRN